MYLKEVLKTARTGQMLSLSIFLMIDLIGVGLVCSPASSAAAEESINIGKISEELARNRKELAAHQPDAVEAELQRLREEDRALSKSLASGRDMPGSETAVSNQPAKSAVSGDGQEGVRAFLSTDQADTPVRKQAASAEAAKDTEPIRVMQGSSRARSRSIFSEPLNGGSLVEGSTVQEESVRTDEAANAESFAVSQVATENRTAPVESRGLERGIISERTLLPSDHAVDVNSAAKASAKINNIPENSGQIQQLNASIDGLKRQVEEARRSKLALQKELDETRNRLILAETEVERLSSIVEDRKQSTIARITGNSAPQSASAPQASAGMRLAVKSNSAAAGAISPAVDQKSAPDMMIATVVADKAALRTGPGKDNSQLLAVSKGTRLAVETRQGEWYRVITPTGTRAWVSATVVAFGPGGKSEPTRTLRGSGYNLAVEDEALKLLRYGK